MKKLFISMFALVSSLSMMATQNAYVQIKLVGTSYPTYSTSKLNLTEDTERNASYESGYDSQSAGTLSNDYSVLIYGYVGSQKCSSVSTNDLTGLEIGFTTNNVDDTYKLKFVDFEGTPFYLYDRLLHKSTLINGSTPDYEFSAPMGQVEVNGRFVIGVPAAYDVTLNAYGYLSFSAIESVSVPDGVDAYQAKYVAMNEEVLLTKINEKIIPANTGVILYGAASANHSLAVLNNGATALPEISLNDLKPSTAWAGATSNAFVLKGDALYEYVGSEQTHCS